ncbi:MAG: type II toxin-antitoxin system HicA family toxin [Phycisphaerales bacterium]
MSPRRLFARIQTAAHNVAFRDLLHLAQALGFTLDRTVGSHRIFIHPRIPDAQLNLQPDGKDAKPYQVKQLLKLVEEYNLTLEESD